jgi:hypothetical protein
LIALAAPVLVGIIFPWTPRPERQSFLLKPSKMCCEAVLAWIVVMVALSMPNSRSRTAAIGARQLVVHEAFETTSIVGELRYSAWLTPKTKLQRGTNRRSASWRADSKRPVETHVLASLLGAEMMTRLAPAASMWTRAWSIVVILPVDSITYSAPAEAQSRPAGSRDEKR